MLTVDIDITVDIITQTELSLINFTRKALLFISDRCMVNMWVLNDPYIFLSVK